MRQSQLYCVRVVAQFVFVFLGLFLISHPLEAHQAVNPNILKLVRPAPSGTPSCYSDPEKKIPTAACIEKGRQLFETGTFDGNGRTCATCHPASNNFTIDLPYIKKLPPNDPLFVSDYNDLLKYLETPLLKKYGLICENLDGFSDVNGKQSCVMRSVIATEGLSVSTAPDPLLADPGTDSSPTSSQTSFTPARPLFPLAGALGWGGDGSPKNGSLRNFVIGAIIQHYPKTLARIPGSDFSLPSSDQLDAMEAFQFSLGRQKEMNLNPDPFARNVAFNCKAYNGAPTADLSPPQSTACTKKNSPFELKTMAELQAWKTDAFEGKLLTFTDHDVTNGQILFFGGIPSALNAPNNIRNCSGCHIQAGAGSDKAKNTPLNADGISPAANRQRATGASLSPMAPICKSEAANVVVNADGGFGAGSNGFPFTVDANENVIGDQPCFATPDSTFLLPDGTKFKSCFKEFTTSTTMPPLSNPSITGAPSSATSMMADVGGTNWISRHDICLAGPTDSVFLTGTGFFSTPSLIEAASTIPLFHNNIAATVEEAVEFYASGVFNDSPSGGKNRMILDLVDDREIPGAKVDIAVSIGAFLRAINAVDNLKISARYLDAAIAAIDKTNEKVRNAKLAWKRAADAVAVLTQGGPTTANYLGGPKNLFQSTMAVSSLSSAKNRLTKFGPNNGGFGRLTLADLTAARSDVSAACNAMLKPDNGSVNDECP